MVYSISIKVTLIHFQSIEEILTDPSSVLEWNPWFKTVSRISVLSSLESSSELHSGDVISVTETLKTSLPLLQYFYGFLDHFRSEKIYER